MEDREWEDSLACLSSILYLLPHTHTPIPCTSISKNGYNTFIEKGEFEGALKPPDSSGGYSKLPSITENVFAYA